MKLDCIRYGNEYGGFYLPSHMPKRMIVYSFGIGEDLSFSEQILEKESYVYAFDPTPRAIKFVAKHDLSKSQNFFFYPYGISDNDGKVNFYLPRNKQYVSGSEILQKNVDPDDVISVDMYCLKTIVKKLGHTRIDILKLDVEGSEFKVIQNIMNGDKKVDIGLVCMETHERFFPDGDRKMTVLLETMERNGYIVIYHQKNEWTFMNNKMVFIS